MKIYQTTLQHKQNHYPSAFDFNRIIYKRSKVQTASAKKELYRLEMGHLGEEKLVEYLQTYGKKHWVVLKNVWLSDGRTFECDIILITSACVYIFEVKNFRGRFHYKNASSTLNGTKLDYDYIQQARKSILKMKKILNELSTQISVKGALVFIGEQNQVRIDSPVEDIEILTVTDLYSTIQAIILEEKRTYTNRLNVAQIIRHLETYEVPSPFLPEPLSTDEILKLKPGIYCDVCGSFDLQFNRTYTICPGCLKEPRQESIVRMALEYGALTYDRNFSTVAIERFIANQASRTFIKDTLAHHLDYVWGNNHSYIQNNTPLYQKSYTKFTFACPRIQYVDRGRLIG